VEVKTFFSCVPTARSEVAVLVIYLTSRFLYWGRPKRHQWLNTKAYYCKRLCLCFYAFLLALYLRNVFLLNKQTWRKKTQSVQNRSGPYTHPGEKTACQRRWKFLFIVKITKTLEQGYSNGGPRSESGPLAGEGRTSSGSQKSLLFTKAFIPKSSALSRASQALTSH